MRPIGRLNGVHVVVGRGWVPARRRSSGGPRTKKTERTSERASEKALERWLLCSGSSGDEQRVAADLSFFAVESKVFFFFFFWLSTGASSPSFLSLVSFCVFFDETPEWNFVSPNGVIDRALGFLSLCSGRRRSSSSWRTRERRRRRQRRRIFAAVELLHSSVTLLVGTSLEVKLKCMLAFLFLGLKS